MKANEEMTIAGNIIEGKRLMQCKGDATCEIKNSLSVMHNIMRTMILEQDDEISRYHQFGMTISCYTVLATPRQKFVGL